MAKSWLVACVTLTLGVIAELPNDVDWIVVGGGASGCTAAAALVDGGHKVLVIERGPSDRDVPDTQSSKTWSKVVPEVAENIRWTDGPWGAVAKVLG
jgi:choline dehydrogenase-like flavoprotein